MYLPFFTKNKGYFLYFLCFIAMIALCATSCNRNKEAVSNEPKLFTSLPSSQTKVTFRNDLRYDRDFNIYKYRNFYNGGGVAIGDINNDGLVDIYMSSNMNHNKLYLNKGNFVFEDVTEKAGVAGTKSWVTGVTMADVNGDGFMDIYVCNSGDIKGDDKENELFINNGNRTFTERAKEYGLADKGYSTQAAFFDYDKDGDLDCYLLNNSYRATVRFNNNNRDVRDSLGGDKLFRNDGNNHFTDVSAEANIYGSLQGFGLGVTIGDVDRDGWDDIYVCNDFFERDYLYINQKNGKFKEVFEEQFGHCSAASMGADLADLNNDGYPDLFNTEMLPANNHRVKMKTTFDSWNTYQNYVHNGYFNQFTHNSLQMNNGDNTWSETAFLAGVGATDWSWGALITDLDNDGLKDIYVANGIYKDLTDQDFIQFISDDQVKKSIITEQGVDYKKLIDVIPSEALPNYAFKNTGNGTFKDMAKAWGLGQPSFSNGAAYADLDNDGDLDLVVNNVNMEAFIYRNETDKVLKDNHFLKFEVEGAGLNTNGLGTKITLKAGNQLFYQEQMPMRGFQSSMDYRPNFGVGNLLEIDSIMIDFPNLKRMVLTKVKTNQTLKVKQIEATLPTLFINKNTTLLVEDNDLIDFKHKENTYSDFDVERLIFQMNSTQGPKIAVGDVNGDKKDDIYVCGARGQSGALYVQSNDKFVLMQNADFQRDTIYEDVTATFFDADGDGDLDLFVGTGGSEVPKDLLNLSYPMEDRLYLNDGKGHFTRKMDAFGKGKPFATGVARAADFNGDGKMDLFVGARLIPAKYGAKTGGYLLQNDGTGVFNGVTPDFAPELKDIGMITDALWVDTDGDKDLDLVIVGEYMPVTIFENQNGKFKNVTAAAGLGKSNGWWNVIKAADLDGDGDLDFVVGNHGLNSRFHADEKHPLSLYYGDFDKNGTSEQLICTYEGENSYPCVLRHDLVGQMPIFKKKFLEYKKYADKTIQEVLTPEQLAGAKKYEAFNLQTAVMINNGKNQFMVKNLPMQAQYSPTFGVEIADFDGDGLLDILTGGNFFESKPEMGRYDANYGTVLKGDGKGHFKSVDFKVSGLKWRGQVRDIVAVTVGHQRKWLVAQNNDKIRAFSLTK
jgi:enediyne biosynthesis protein E4